MVKKRVLVPGKGLQDNLQAELFLLVKERNQREKYCFAVHVYRSSQIGKRLIG